MFSNNFMFLLLSLLLKTSMPLVHVWERMHRGMLSNSLPIPVNSECPIRTEKDYLYSDLAKVILVEVRIYPLQSVDGSTFTTIPPPLSLLKIIWTLGKIAQW